MRMHQGHEEESRRVLLAPAAALERQPGQRQWTSHTAPPSSEGAAESGSRGPSPAFCDQGMGGPARTADSASGPAAWVSTPGPAGPSFIYYTIAAATRSHNALISRSAVLHFSCEFGNRYYYEPCLLLNSNTLFYKNRSESVFELSINT